MPTFPFDQDVESTWRLIFDAPELLKKYDLDPQAFFEAGTELANFIMLSTYCEQGIGDLATQPINTLSNLAFWVAAFFAYRLLKKHGVKSPSLYALPLVMLGIGAGSMLWHGAPSEITVIFDDLFIIIFAAISLLYLLDYVFVTKLKAGLGIAFLFVLQAPFIFHWLPTWNGFASYGLLLVMCLTVIGAVTRKNSKHLRPLLGVMGLFALALVFRTLDLYVCDWIPFGSHLLWHITNAAVTFFAVSALVHVYKSK